jgi:surface antigen
MVLMSRMILSLGVLLATSFSAPPAFAQQGAPQAATQPDAQGRCQNQETRRRRGNLFGNIANRALGRAGVPSNVAGVGLPTEQLLSEAITAMLDCRERQQAAAATNEAIRGGVGTTSTWQSDTRPNVSGTSSATGDERLADGTHCVMVTNIVIVDGEETSAQQRMCRAPGSRGYARV